MATGIDTLNPMTEVDSQIQLLLEDFKDIFAEPKDLPPFRAVEHQIVLKEGSQPFKMQPYKYPYLQRR